MRGLGRESQVSWENESRSIWNRTGQNFRPTAAAHTYARRVYPRATVWAVESPVCFCRLAATPPYVMHQACISLAGDQSYAPLLPVLHHSFLPCRYCPRATQRLFLPALISHPGHHTSDRLGASTPPQEPPRVPSFARRPVYITHDTHFCVCYA